MPSTMYTHLKKDEKAIAKRFKALDILPGEFLAYPVKASLRNQSDLLLALGGLYLILKEHVDAERIDVGVVNSDVRSGVGLRP